MTQTDALDLPTRSWRGPALCHLPEDAGCGPVESYSTSDAPANRWNAEGEPTMYLASDLSVAVGEWARHLDDGGAKPGQERQARRLYELEVDLEGLVDLSDRAVLSALEVEDAPHAFLDSDIATAVAQRVRRQPGTRGLITPSMGFLDEPDRRVLVVFLDKLGADLERCVRETGRSGLLEVGTLEG
jgi:RES domain-containing protein